MLARFQRTLTTILDEYDRPRPASTDCSILDGAVVLSAIAGLLLPDIGSHEVVAALIPARQRMRVSARVGVAHLLFASEARPPMATRRRPTAFSPAAAAAG